VVVQTQDAQLGLFALVHDPKRVRVEPKGLARAQPDWSALHGARIEQRDGLLDLVESRLLRGLARAGDVINRRL